jgi:hypothetical protein
MSSCSLGTVDTLDILTLGKGSLVATQTSLSKLVDSLVHRSSSSLDHIKNASFIWGKAGYFSDQRSDHGDALSAFLSKEETKVLREMDMFDFRVEFAFLSMCENR